MNNKKNIINLKNTNIKQLYHIRFPTIINFSKNSEKNLLLTYRNELDKGVTIRVTPFLL